MVQAPSLRVENILALMGPCRPERFSWFPQGLGTWFVFLSAKFRVHISQQAVSAFNGFAIEEYPLMIRL